VPSSAFRNCRMGWEVQLESQANSVSRPGYQLADVENTVISTNTLGVDTQTGPGVRYPSGMTDISANSQAHMLIRFGLWVKNASGTALNCVRVHLWLEYEEAA
jgi:hypothetical protein